MLPFWTGTSESLPEDPSSSPTPQAASFPSSCTLRHLSEEIVCQLELRIMHRLLTSFTESRGDRVLCAQCSNGTGMQSVCDLVHCIKPKRRTPGNVELWSFHVNTRNARIPRCLCFELPRCRNALPAIFACIYETCHLEGFFSLGSVRHPALMSLALPSSPPVHSAVHRLTPVTIPSVAWPCKRLFLPILSDTLEPVLPSVASWYSFTRLPFTARPHHAQRWLTLLPSQVAVEFRTRS